MQKKIKIAYDLLTDMTLLESKQVLTLNEISYLLSGNLSHRYSKSFLGRQYIYHYYAPMIVSAFNLFGKGAFLELGCGTGTQIIYAKKTGFNLASGIDMVPDRIRIAQKRSIFHEAHNDTTIEVKDFWKFHPEKRYDAIYSMFAFELFGKTVSEAGQYLVALCSPKATIILDMGNVKRLHKQNYFTDISNELVKRGFKVRLEPLFPFLSGTRLAKILGKCNLWPFFRAVRLIATIK